MELFDSVSLVLIFIFGAIIGSFLNVVIYRLGSGSSLGGRSKCLACGKILRAHMLIPLWSYLFLRARCAYCQSRISAQYFFVECTTGLLFVLAASVNHLNLFFPEGAAFLLFLFEASILSTLVVVTAYDLKHKIIPDRLSLLFALLAGALLLLKWHLGIFPETFTSLLGDMPQWIDVAAGPLLALPFGALWFFSGGRAMGFGDAKLAWGIGWFLGFSKGITAVIFSFWIAFIPSLILLLLPRKSFTMKSEIPFAPFLVLGTLVVYAFGLDLFNWVF
jgi:leader peptidase (prepilin peptidase)/N-methyltransferase